MESLQLSYMLPENILLVHSHHHRNTTSCTRREAVLCQRCSLGLPVMKHRKYLCQACRFLLHYSKAFTHQEKYSSSSGKRMQILRVAAVTLLPGLSPNLLCPSGQDEGCRAVAHLQNKYTGLKNSNWP